MTLAANERFIFLAVWGIYILAVTFRKSEAHLHVDELAVIAIHMIAVSVIFWGLFPRTFAKGKTPRFLAQTFGVLIVAAGLQFALTGLTSNWFENLNYRYFMVSAFAQTSGVIAFFVGIKMAFENERRSERIRQLDKDNRETKLKFLNRQITPHFLLNTMNNMYGFAVEKSEKLPELIMRVSAVLKYMVYGQGAGRLAALGDELQLVRDFADLNRVQLENRARVSVELPSNHEGFFVPPLLLLPLVENAFKHSTETLDDKIQIKIAAHLTGNRLKFEVENNFPAARKGKAETGTGGEAVGLGLQNLEARLRLIFGDDYTLNLDHGKTTFRATLDIPLDRSPE